MAEPSREVRPPYELEKVVTGAGGVSFCMLRGPDGSAALLKEGEKTALGYRVERILPGGKGGGTVFLARGDEAITLRAAPE